MASQALPDLVALAPPGISLSTTLSLIFIPLWPPPYCLPMTKAYSHFRALALPVAFASNVHLSDSAWLASVRSFLKCHPFREDFPDQSQNNSINCTPVPSPCHAFLQSICIIWHMKYLLVFLFTACFPQKCKLQGTSLLVQWVRLCAPNAGGPGLIPGQGTRSCMHATTKSLHAATKIPCAPTKTWSSQNK